MARGNGSTFDESLPVAKKYNAGAINWGLVAGKTQTYLPWDSWQRPYVLTQPTIWFMKCSGRTIRLTASERWT